MPKVTKLNPIPKHVSLYVENTKRMVQYIQSTTYFGNETRSYKCWWCDLSVDHAPLIQSGKYTNAVVIMYKTGCAYALRRRKSRIAFVWI